MSPQAGRNSQGRGPSTPKAYCRGASAPYLAHWASFPPLVGSARLCLGPLVAAHILLQAGSRHPVSFFGWQPAAGGLRDPCMRLRCCRRQHMCQVPSILWSKGGERVALRRQGPAVTVSGEAVLVQYTQGPKAACSQGIQRTRLGGPSSGGPGALPGKKQSHPGIARHTSRRPLFFVCHERLRDLTGRWSLRDNHFDAYFVIYKQNLILLRLGLPHATPHCVINSKFKWGVGPERSWPSAGKGRCSAHPDPSQGPSRRHPLPCCRPHGPHLHCPVRILKISRA